MNLVDKVSGMWPKDISFVSMVVAFIGIIIALTVGYLVINQVREELSGSADVGETVIPESTEVNITSTLFLVSFLNFL